MQYSNMHLFLPVEENALTIRTFLKVPLRDIGDRSKKEGRF